MPLKPISTELPIVRTWRHLEVGMTVRTSFRITAADMATFAKLSGDCSRIHWDAEFSKKNGFEEPVVYGALTVARLSHLVGMHLPGDLGLATNWKIDFKNPLYVDEEATFEGEIAHISEATHTVKIKFSVSAVSKHNGPSNTNHKFVASGFAGSKILHD